MSSTESHTRLALTCAGVLYGVASAVGAGLLWTNGVRDVLSFMVVLGVAASATILFIVAGLTVPNLFAVGRIAFPLNLTLPVVYVLLLVVSVLLWTSTGSALVLVPEPLLPARLWAVPKVLGMTAVLQCVMLSGLAAISKGDKA